MSRLTKWPSAAGEIKISEMESNHLYMTVRMLHRYAEDRRWKYKCNGYETTYNDRYIRDWIEDMDREINRRNKLRLSPYSN